MPKAKSPKPEAKAKNLRIFESMRTSGLLKESIRVAFSALIANKFRSLLSLLGVVIGIFVIVLIKASVDSLARDVNKTINGLGEDVVFVHKWPWQGGFEYPFWKFMLRPQPVVEETNRLRQRLGEFAHFSYRATSSRNMRYRDRQFESGSLHGVYTDFDKVQQLKIEKGRYFTEGEIRTGKAVAVLGFNVADALFPHEEPLGKTIRIGPRKAEIIGVLQKKGESILDVGEDDRTFIPYAFFATMVDMRNWRTHREIIVKRKEGVPNELVKEEVVGAMRTLRKLKPKEEDNFSLNEASMIAKEMEPVSRMLNIAGLVIGALAILVGAFGVANIMFVSVRERTGQIGIQKALGAKRNFILLQFLGESIMLTLVGGLAGIGLVFLSAFIVRQVSSFELFLTPWHVAYGLIISGLVGLISGLAPAWTAAKMNPVDAIRQG